MARSWSPRRSSSREPSPSGFSITVGIESADPGHGLSIRRADNGELEWLPPDLRAYFPVEPGIYTLKRA